MADDTKQQRTAEEGSLGRPSSWGAGTPARSSRRKPAAGSPADETLQFTWRPGASDFPEPLGASARQKPVLRTGEHPYAALPPIEFPFPVHETAHRTPVKVIPPIFAVLVIIGAFLARDRWLPKSDEVVSPTATVMSAPTATAGEAPSLLTQVSGAGTPSVTTTSATTATSQTPTPGVTVTSGSGPSNGFEPGLVEAAEGDTLIDIADAIGLHVSTLVWANEIDDPGAPLTAGTLVVVPPADGVLHTVVDGDSLASIAEMYGLDPSEITGITENGVTSDLDVHPGMVLFIPGAALTSRSDVASYAVREGDNLWGIADYYGLNPFTLAWANDLAEPFVIQEGQQLTIPPADGIYLLVGVDETVESLAASYGVDPAVIRDFAFNRMQDPFSEPKVGQPLMIPSLDALVQAWDARTGSDQAEPTPVG